MSFRKLLFWIHLVAGIISGIVIAIMSFTGAVLAFETELVDWSQRAQAHVEVPENAERLTADELLTKVQAADTEQPATGITLYPEPDRAAQVSFGRREHQYLNPYTGALIEPGGTWMEDFMHEMMFWHRWLALSGEQRDIGRVITGICNLAFVVLIATGIYLWWPRRWTAKVLRGQLWFKGGLKPKARDFNWHNVLGFWSALPLLIFSVTATYWSYGWARTAYQNWTGSARPQAPQITIDPATVTGPKASLETLVTAALEQVPHWQEVQLQTGESSPPRRGPGGHGPQGGQAAAEPQGPQPVSINVRNAETFFPRRPDQLLLHPVTGEVLYYQAAADYPFRAKMGMAIRDIHTSRVIGPIGQILGALACLAAVVLVWTGFALAWRRFFGKSKRKGKPNATAPAAS
ncbi:MAG: PepSY-associated TM helix domain-containing protein [Puniceicoccaceae bacterium 5H]|nr:MAG: PepSY-associated TM helix domain-containing protein [Puniceicoccaceae bacterium 5H]